METFVFVVAAAIILTGAIGVVASRSPVHSALSLVMTLFGVAVLFVAQEAHFLAAVQIIVYAGAIVVLFLFVIMLLGPSASTPNDRRGVVVRVLGGGGFGLVGLATLVAVARAAAESKRSLPMPSPDAGFGGIEPIGSALFSDALVPFELSSALLMVAVVGALAVAKGRQGVHSLSKSEQEVARQATPRTPEEDTHGGVYGELAESTRDHP
jgi:NADH-quinone oxidoreductase subunit J